MLPDRRPRTRRLLLAGAAVAGLVLAGCAAPSSTPTQAHVGPWSEVLRDAHGQTVRLWMWGGDPQGNAYVDDVLAPAAREELGVNLERVPVADTGDAVNRVLDERRAGTDDGAVDLVWVNGDSFGTGQQAGAWLCGWTAALPNMRFTDPGDPLLTNDFGTPVDGCEVPWHKAQFSLVYNSARVTDPPTSLEGVLRWAERNPGRFTYPAPPDFTGSVFVREVLIAVSGGSSEVPTEFDQAAFDRLTPALYDRLADLAPSLWRHGSTYPRDSVALDRLYADGQIDMTMTYGPATLTKLVEQGTFPKSTEVLTLHEGSVGNASFLAIPETSPHTEAAMAVANLALSPEQQAIKADPAVWGQFTVLDTDKLAGADRAAFAKLPQSSVVPRFEELSRNAHAELAAEWVPELDDGWRREVLGAGS